MFLKIELSGRFFIEDDLTQPFNITATTVNNNNEFTKTVERLCQSLNSTYNGKYYHCLEDLLTDYPECFSIIDNQYHLRVKDIDETITVKYFERIL